MTCCSVGRGTGEKCSSSATLFVCASLNTFLNRRDRVDTFGAGGELHGGHFDIGYGWFHRGDDDDAGSDERDTGGDPGAGGEFQGHLLRRWPL